MKDYLKSEDYRNSEKDDTYKSRVKKSKPKVHKMKKDKY